MRKYLYKDLYDLEDKHFWHLGKRELAKMLICKFVNNGSCASPVKKYKKTLKDQRVINILDIGCHGGDLTNVMSRATSCKLYGIDISPDAITFAKKRFPHINFSVSDFPTTHNFESGFFGFNNNIGEGVPKVMIGFFGSQVKFKFSKVSGNDFFDFSKIG